MAHCFSGVSIGPSSHSSINLCLLYSRVSSSMHCAQQDCRFCTLRYVQKCLICTTNQRAGAVDRLFSPNRSIKKKHTFCCRWRLYTIVCIAILICREDDTLPSTEHLLNDGESLYYFSISSWFADHNNCGVSLVAE